MINFKKKKTWLSLLVLILVLGIFYLLGHFVSQHMKQLDAYIQAQGNWAPLLFTLIFCLLPLIFFSTDVLCFTAGALFGFWPGIFYATLGILGSASLMFLLAKFLAKNPVRRAFKKYPKFLAFSQVINEKGLKVLLLLRVSPLPFAPLSYFLGTTRIKFYQYLISVFGTFLTVIAGVYYGYTAKHLVHLAGPDKQLNWIRESLIFGGLVAMMVAVVLAGKIAYQKINKMTDHPEKGKESLGVDVGDANAKGRAFANR